MGEAGVGVNIVPGGGWYDFIGGLMIMPTGGGVGVMPMKGLHRWAWGNPGWG